MYEDEVRKDTVIAQLNAINENLEKIKQNQYMLYQQVVSIRENTDIISGSVKSYAQKSKQAAKEKSRYAMEESPRATSRCFMFMYFLLPH